jgi:hypothetical protein
MMRLVVWLLALLLLVGLVYLFRWDLYIGLPWFRLTGRWPW